MTFPVVAGDECLVVFSSRCIDAWWQNGGYANNQAMFRMHDLSDGFAFVGISSVPQVQPAISTNSVQLRNNAGTIYVEIGAAAVNIVAPTINLTGSVVVTGTLTDNGINVGSTHYHTGVTAGAGITGGPA
jgi:phage baseplate assembly protein gpV